MTITADINRFYLIKFDSFLNEMQTLRNALSLANDASVSISNYYGIAADLEFMKTDMMHARSALEALSAVDRCKKISE